MERQAAFAGQSSFATASAAWLHHVSYDVELRKDLLQEGLLYVWRIESKAPDHDEAWYMDECHRFLGNFIRTGRSVDSLKRRRLRCTLDGLYPQLLDDSSRSIIAARDIIAELNPLLTPGARTVLLLLAHGYDIHEIALELRISHQAVSKQRRQIAAMARRLGIRPL